MRFLFLTLATLLVTCGCDLGTYSSRYKEVAGSGSSGSSVELAGAVVIDGNIKVRLPTLLGDEYSQQFGPSDEFRKARVYGMDFPGFKKSFIGDKESGDGAWLPVQAYFYVTPADGKSIVDFKQETKKVVEGKNPGYSERWEDLTVVGFDGKERVWSKNSLLVNQEFNLASGNGTKREQLLAQMEMLVTTNGTQNLLVIFRSPADIFDTELQLSTIKSLQGFHE